MKILHYEPNLLPYFRDLNFAWVERFFTIELEDRWQLENAESAIIDKGGSIYFVEEEGEIVGTVALIPEAEGILQLAKMAVSEAAQGKGIGKVLCSYAIYQARQQGVEKLMLYSNSVLKPALHIYRSLGFKDVAIADTRFSRADVKMEMSFVKEIPSPWFERKFSFTLSPKLWQENLLRFSAFPLTCMEYLQIQDAAQFEERISGKWSVKEQLGHLVLMEKLWQERVNDFMNEKSVFTAADLSNAATQESRFNQFSYTELIEAFISERKKTVALLSSLDERKKSHTLLHPRLGTPMSAHEFLYFMAEHDEHHFQYIRFIMHQIELHV